MLTVLLGGARSGKSALAVRLASEAGTPVTFLATAEALDGEMAARIATHRASRPPTWSTVEEPLHVEAALSGAPAASTVVLDCLTMWVANLLGAGASDDDILTSAAALSDLAAHRAGLVVAVSNEVGSGIVPASAISRQYRDLLGQVNTLFALRATEAFLVVAGCLLALKRLPVGGPAA